MDYFADLRCSLIALGICFQIAFAPIVVEAQERTSPFDGKSWALWTMMDERPVPEGWEMKDGVVHLKKEKARVGHIVTTEEYGDFTLEFEWKIAPGGNSGLKYRVRSYENRTIGCEYQVYDDAGAKKVAPKYSSGSIYDLYEPNEAKKMNPAGEWNHAKIVASGPRLEHWLNGEKIVSATIGDAEWKRRLGESKFNDAKGFGEKKGKIMLTDHGSEVWYRNFVFKSGDK
ncbi:MAG: DUF1080 domain-containing protein [Pirellula sp.]